MEEKQLQALAVGLKPQHYGLLPDAAIERWSNIRKFLTEEWKKSTDESRTRATLIRDCLNKLTMTLLQAHRIREVHDNLIATASKNRDNVRNAIQAGDDISIAQAGVTWCGDFESLLLHARAALDCLSLLIRRDIEGLDKDYSFRELPNVLRNNVPKRDLKAQAIIDVIALSEDWTQGLLTKVENDGLRDFVAHRGSLATRTSSCFQITFTEPDRVLILDCETRLYPIFRTTSEAVQHVSHLILNVISVVASMNPLSMDAFNCCWHNRSVVFSDYAIEEQDDPLLTQHHLNVCKRMTPSGADYTIRNVDPRIFEMTVSLGTPDDG